MFATTGLSGLSVASGFSNWLIPNVAPLWGEHGSAAASTVF